MSVLTPRLADGQQLQPGARVCRAGPGGALHAATVIAESVYGVHVRLSNGTVVVARAENIRPALELVAAIGGQT